MCKQCYDRDRRRQKGQGTWPKKAAIPSTLTSSQQEILDGSLLGDSYLYCYKRQVNAGLAIKRQVKDSDFLYFEYEQFKDFCKNLPRTGSTFDPRTKKSYSHISFRTRLAPVFTEQRKRWYPHEIKSVPDDLVLTPLTCAIWFADDGSVHQRSHKDGTFGLSMTLYTDGFTKAEVERLCRMLNEVTNSELKVSPHERNWIIRGGYEASLQVARYIDPVFPETMNRKSDRWRPLL